MDELKWFVAHTRPRCEKKLDEYCGREGLESCLPCYKAAHRYLRKAVVFHKPLFPGYLFVRMLPVSRHKVLQSDYVANLLTVTDQVLFQRQLDDILKALETDLEIRLAPQIGPGCRVVIKSGPLRGMDGWVEQRHGVALVLLRLDFIGQAAAVKVPATELELV